MLYLLHHFKYYIYFILLFLSFYIYFLFLFFLNQQMLLLFIVLVLDGKTNGCLFLIVYFHGVMLPY